MNSLLCLVVLVPCALSVAVPMVSLSQSYHLQTDVDMGKPIQHIFASFVQIHKKSYADQYETEMRKGIFAANVKHITEHNEKYTRGEKSYYLGVNQFTDLTHREFLNFYTGHIRNNKQFNGSTYLADSNVHLPDSVDWRDKGYVTPIKNQGECGSCWSFSATGSLEGQHFKKSGNLVSLSEQQLVDCSGSYGNEGCNGGLMDQAFEYIQAVGGLESEDDYPYKARDEKKCKYEKAKERAEVTGYVDVESGSEDQLQDAVATKGPVSIAIDASHPSFQSYAGGIYDEEECSSTQLDHGVLVVGYGTDTADYWLVKNSWGTSWGDEGYIRMTRNKDNQCGVATQASYPLV